MEQAATFSENAPAESGLSNVLGEGPNISYKTEISCLPVVIQCVLIEAIIGMIGWGLWRLL